MKTLNDGAMRLLLVAMTAAPVFAAAATTAASSPDGYATRAHSAGKSKANAVAQQDDRMARCQAMSGAEKSACEAEAKALARKAVKHAAPRRLASPPRS